MTPLVIACGVALAAFLVYLPALRNDFVNWDDDEYVYNNPSIQEIGPRLVSWAFFRFHIANWHPLTWLSHALDVAVWGLNPLGHHLTNNLLHAVNSFLVVLLAMKLLEVARRRSAPGIVPPFLSDSGIRLAAASAGLLFALHPLHVESVAWISERKDLLCALFFLLGILLYLPGKEAEATVPETSPVFNTRYFQVLACFVLALLSKPMAVTFPLVLLLLDWYPLNRFKTAGSARRIALEKAPLLLLSLGSAIITIFAQKSWSAIATFEYAPPATRILVAVRAFSTYLLNLTMPMGLAPLYPYPREAALLDISYLLPLLLLLVVVSLCVIPWKWRRPWSAYWGYYAVTLLPVIGLVQIGFQSMADRYTYLPSIAPLLGAGLFAAWAWDRLSNPSFSLRNPFRIAGLVAGPAVVVILTWLTIVQIGIWRNSFTLWNYEITLIPNKNPVAYYHRAMAYARVKNYDAAISDYSTAISQDPNYYEAYNNRAVLYDAFDRLEQAISDYSRSLALKPHYQVYYNRGASYSRLGLFREAVQDFSRSLSLKPDNAGAYVNRGFAYDRMGNQQDARGDFEKGCSMKNEVGCEMLNKMNKRNGRK